jgi:hypothetical protein
LAKGDGIDSGNSSSTPLAGAATFPGSSKDISRYRSIAINVYSNVASATDGLSIQQSADGTNWDHTDVFTVPADTGKVYTIAPHAQYLKVVYTNGGSAQTSFRLQTILRAGEMTPSSHRIQDAISDDDDAQLVKSVLTGKANGSFVNVQTTADGDLKISNNSDGLAIAKGDVTGHTFIHKFGEAPDFDSTDGEVNIWDGANDGGINKMVYTYSTDADIDTISSSNAGDTQTIEVQGLDTNWAFSTETATLNGQTKVVLSEPLRRVFRLKNTGSTDLSGDVYCYVDTTISGGVPTTTGPVRAIIQTGNNQTLMAVYTVPAAKTGYLRDWYSVLAGASKSTNYKMRLWARPFGGVFQLKHVSALNENGTSALQHKYEEPEVFDAKTDIALTVEITAGSITAADIAGGFDIVLVDD